MSLWTAHHTLFDVKDILATVFNDMHPKFQRIKDVICTTNDEFQTLCRLISQIDSEEKFSKHCICIIVGWVESYRHHDNIEFYNHVIDRYSKIPQHALGKFLITYQDAFHEYGLDTFNEPLTSLDRIESVIKKHAGITATT